MLPGERPTLPDDQWYATTSEQVWGGGNRHRHQFRCEATRKRMLAGMRARMQHHGVLGDRECRQPYVLRTTDAAAPAAAVQSPHWDFLEPTMQPYRDDTHRIPLSCQWAVTQAYELRVYRWECHCTCSDGVPGWGWSCTIVHVPGGHMAVWRGDTSHGGGSHLSSEPRVHCFAVPPDFPAIADAFSA